MNCPPLSRPAHRHPRHALAGLAAALGLALVGTTLLADPARAAGSDPVLQSFRRMLQHEPSRVQPARPAGEPVDPLYQAIVLPLRDGSGDAGAPLAARQLHAEGIDAFAHGRRAEAYGRFAAAADLGHGASASLALAMVRHGPVLFGSAWSASEGQIERWTTLARLDLQEHLSALSGLDRAE